MPESLGHRLSLNFVQWTLPPFRRVVASSRSSKAIYPGTGLLIVIRLGLPSCTCHLLNRGGQSIRVTSTLLTCPSCAYATSISASTCCAGLPRSCTTASYESRLLQLSCSYSHIFISSTLHLNSSPGPYGLKQPLSVSLIESEVLRCSLGSLCSVDRDILLYNLWFVN